MMRRSSLMVALLIVMLLCAPHAMALRATPAQVIIPVDQSGAFSVRILDAQQPTDIVVSVDGDLADMMSLNAAVQHAEGGLVVTGTVLIPTNLSPGDHVQYVIIAAAPRPGEGTVNARAEIAVPIIVRVPYPDAYLTGSWHAQPDAGLAASRITVTLENRGRVPVTPEHITVLFEEDIPPIVFITEEIAPGAFLRTETVYVLPIGVLPGIYDATLTVPYAQATFEQSAEIVLGVPGIVVSQVAYDTAEQGTIIPVDVEGTIAWNRPLPVTIAIWLDDATTPAATSVVDVDTVLRERLYIDTTRVGAPVTSVRVTVTAGDISASRTQFLPTTPAVEQRGVSVWWVVALALFILLLVLLVLLWRHIQRPPARPVQAPSIPSEQAEVAS